MPVPELGRLEPVSPREVWSKEDRDLTPWLLANADVLAEALGIELELAEAEHAVGGFRLDLLGTDITNDTRLIVENQLEVTNHSHLGQLITYAAGTGAGTIVWIATSFREEYRQALDWLNEHTDEDVHFFGVEIGAARIGQSVPAPLLRVVASPNDWQKRVRVAAAQAQAGGKGELYYEFWEKYLERVASTHPEWTRRRKPFAGNWFDLPGPLRTRLSQTFAKEGLRHELYIDTGDAEQNESLFARLADRRGALESAYGYPLEFEELLGRRASRIAEYMDGSVTESERHDEFINWLIDRGERLRAALDAIRFDEPGVQGSAVESTPV